eukprot:TRINITY_DN1587_c8_g1_i1.p1 TRINITY_DN1587_c8_g1~~TRINITY_DN1587_c8_g1_i1.p1  ORF type:complete len:352 (+),score=50.98 TRINITY_DN1587_c8_g1_i1:36-1058(+)
MATKGGGKKGGGKGGKKGKKGPPVCFNCGVEGHVSRDCISLHSSAPDVVDVPVENSTIGYVDTHCHLDYVLEKSKVGTWEEFLMLNEMPANYEAVISVFCDPTAILSDALSAYPDLIQSGKYANVFGTVGIHPHNAGYYNDRIEQKMIEMALDERMVGWGEIGLDVTSEKKGAAGVDVQLPIFEKQLQIASNLVPDKPIVIHYRGECRTLLEVLEKNCARSQKFHLHSWGSPDVLGTTTLLDSFPNIYLGFTGGITFPGAKTQRLRGMIAEAVPLSRMLLETDGPYMLPNMLSPGKQRAQPICHPGHIPYIASELAKIKHVGIDDVYRAARENTRLVYSI